MTAVRLSMADLMAALDAIEAARDDVKRRAGRSVNVTVMSGTYQVHEWLRGRSRPVVLGPFESASAAVARMGAL